MGMKRRRKPQANLDAKAAKLLEDMFANDPDVSIKRVHVDQQDDWEGQQIFEVNLFGVLTEGDND